MKTDLLPKVFLSGQDTPTEEQLERARFLAAVREGEQAIREGRTRPADEIFADLKAKHVF